jgi:RIO kinase 1
VPRRRFDDDDFPVPGVLDRARPSTYPDAQHGPQPPPDWVITTGTAIDHERGVIKTGKEADVDLVERSDPDSGRSVLLAAKRYRTAEHRMFHRDAGYLEGRRVRKSRETRAMATRTDFGRLLIAGQWAATEFELLGRLWASDVAVPYPVQLSDTELLLEFIGDGDGRAAPRLAEIRPSAEELDDLWEQCRHLLRQLADTGYAHADLSAYNVLVDDGRLVLIDLPQAVDVVHNPQGLGYLERDCRNICAWFTSRGQPDADPDDLLAELML